MFKKETVRREFVGSWTAPTPAPSSLLEKRKAARQTQKTILVIGLVAFLFILIPLVYRETPLLKHKFGFFSPSPSRQIFTTLPAATPTLEPFLVREKALSVLAGLSGDYGLYFEELAGEKKFSFNGQKVFSAASLIKLPVLLTLYREAEAGRVDLETVYRLRNTDRQGGAGSLQYQPEGTAKTYRQLAELMGQQSDNTAFNVLKGILGGERVQQTIALLGMKNTSLAENETTAEDVGLFFHKLYLERVVSEKSRDEILGFLTKTIWEDRIPAGVPEGVRVAHKIGTELRVISDAGIVFAVRPYILVILSENVSESEARQLLPEISRVVYRTYLPD